MSIKVQPGFTTLCARCNWAIVTTFENGSTAIHCSEFSARVHRVVVKCSAYTQKNSTTKREMETIAWTVSTDKSGKTIGFKPPKPVTKVRSWE